MPRTRAFRLPARALWTGLPVALLLVLVPAVLAAATLPPTILRLAEDRAVQGLASQSRHAGDVNGDGYGDVIVGAQLNDAGGTDCGAAYLYFGGPNPDDVADVMLVGEAADDRFGAAVGAAGDVNGDGYDDVVVGAYRNDAAGTNAGRAYVYLGGPAMDTAPDLVLTGEAAGDYFGLDVDAAGDLNRDGYGDVVVGAYLNDAGSDNAGRAYVYYGGSAPDAAVDLTLTGPVLYGNLGSAVGTAGDVNGDGFDDLVVGASGTSGSRAGNAYVYFGGAAPDTVADLTMSGEEADNRFGTSVGTAGDVNGDGYDDFVVGASSNDTGGTYAGAAYLFLGGGAPDTVADLSVYGVAAYDEFGSRVGAAGDLNGDGYDDFVVGVNLDDAAGTNAGAAYVFLGSASPDGEPDVVLLGENADDRFGLSVGGTGDVDGDGHPDLLVGAYNTVGRVYVFDMVPPPAAQRRELSFTGEANSDQQGFSVSGAGDVDGDGHPDAIAGAPYANVGALSDAGRAYVQLGGPDADAGAELTLDGAAASDNFGRAVGSAGDLNGDGWDDVIVGAPGNDAGGGNAGRAYLYYGGATLDATADLVLTGLAAGDQFGWSVGRAGDVNGDGYDDVVVGAKGNDAGGSVAGQAYVFFGGASPDAVADWTFTGEAAGDQLGQSVGRAGDVNGDGYGDVVVGAYAADATWINAGRAYVYFGGAAPDATPDLTVSGVAADDNLGHAVGAAGDVNGDGYDDVVVGAPNNDTAGANAGQAYVFFGGVAPDATADLVLTGEAAGDYFGTSVGAAGDVNGDGYDDVAVGAYLNDAGGTNGGRVYVYHGGALIDAVADRFLTGTDGEEFGYSLATMGDFTAEGYADLVIGSPHYNGSGSYVGAARVQAFARYFLASPNGGEIWTRNATETVSWQGEELADLWLSTDGGATYALLAGNVGGAVLNHPAVTVPNVVTEQAVVKVVPTRAWIAGSDSSDAVFTVQASTGVEPGDAALRFRAPWPNPARGLVRFGVELARPAVVTVTVLDVAGREVARPIAGEKFEAGSVTREWSPAALAPGVYTVRAKAGEARFTRRLVWLGGR